MKNQITHAQNSETKNGLIVLIICSIVSPSINKNGIVLLDILTHSYITIPNAIVRPEILQIL